MLTILPLQTYECEVVHQLQKMGSRKETLTVAILFADVVGFSLSLARDGEGTIRELLKNRRFFKGLAEKHDGVVVDTAGDSILCRFDDLERCMDCAVAFQIASRPRSVTRMRCPTLKYRIGISFGTVLCRDFELFGNPVVEAARVCSSVNPGEIGLSSIARARVPPKYESRQWRIASSIIKQHENMHHAYAFDPSSVSLVSSTYALAPNIDCGGPQVLVAGNNDGSATQSAAPCLRTELLKSAVAARLFDERMRVQVHDSDRTDFWATMHARGNPIEYFVRCNVTALNSRYAVRTLTIYAPSSTVVGVTTRHCSNETDLPLIFELVAIECSQSVLHHQAERINAMSSTPKTTYHFISKAVRHLHTTTEHSIHEAISSARQALKLQPENPRALSTLARAYCIAWRFDWQTGSGDPLSLSMDLSFKAKEAAPDDFRCQSDFGFCALWAQESEQSLTAYEIASLRAANDPDLSADHAMALSGIGEKNQALELLKSSLIQNPMDPDNRLWSLADVLFSSKQYDDARRILMKMSNPLQASRLQAACAVRTGQDARPFVKEILDRQPNFSVERWISIQPPSSIDEVADFAEAMLEAELPP